MPTPRLQPLNAAPALQPAPGRVWPSPCEICRRWARSRICPVCVDRFLLLHVNRCGCCALPLASAAPRCGACTLSPPPFEKTVCAVDYAFPWDRLLINFKFHQQPELAGPLAQQLVHAVKRCQTDLPDALIAVPLSAQGLARRGYNQAWELARRVASAVARPAWPLALQRLLDTPHQAGLSRPERLRNLRHAFWVAPAGAAQVQGRHLALVDDVMTTGATAHEATTALLRAGARRVDLWVLARTPAPGS